MDVIIDKRVTLYDHECRNLKVVGRRNIKIIPLSVNERRRILPLHQRHAKVENETKIGPDFQILFIAALLVGLPIPTSLWRTNRTVVDSFLSTWNRGFILIRSMALVMYFSNSRRFWSTVTNEITFDLQIIAGYVTIWIFYIKRRTVESSLKNLRSLSPTLLPEGNSFIKIKLLLCTLVHVLFTWTAAKFFYSGVFDSVSKRLNPGVPSPQDTHYYFTSLMIISFIFSYYAGSAVLYVQVLLCSRAYWSCGRLLRWYGEELQRVMKQTPLSSDAVSRMLAEFKSVSTIIKDLDRTLGECPLVIYLYVLNDVCTVMGALFAKDRKHGSIEFEVFLVARALSAIAMFLYLTHNADAVAREKRALQRKMARISSSIMAPTTTSYVVAVFQNLYSSVKSTDLYITCFDLFDIERKIILSGGGVLVTYGAWLYQFAAAE